MIRQTEDTQQRSTPPRGDEVDAVTLRRAIDGGDPATLLMVLVQLTGERRWLDEARAWISGPMRYHERMSEDLRRAIRDALYDRLTAMRARGEALPPIPTGRLLAEMLSVAAGDTLPDEYVPMMREELDPQAGALRGMIWRGAPPPRAVLARYKVVIVGAGMSGILAAIRLKEAGLDFVIYEKNADVGGTWLENVYPGCGVDTPNHFYSYSFEPDHEWSHFFAKRDELWDYFRKVAERHDLLAHIRFGTAVEALDHDAATGRWTVRTRGSDGASETVDAAFVISAVGILNRPKWPEIPGLDDFAGPLLHTAQWDRDFDWRGKRVGLLGTGASGHQLGPTIAPDVERLTIFQRSPHWVVPNPTYFDEVSPAKQLALTHIPFYARWYRFQLFWAFADGLHASLQADPAWEGQPRSINLTNARHRDYMERFIRSKLGEDSPLLEKVIPDYPPYAKRILIDNHWFDMLLRDNVDLVTDPIRRITPEGVETADGALHPLDALVCATGFAASRMLVPMEVRGRGGVRLHDVWPPDDATAYMGTMVPQFPNLFLMLGPNTALAHGGNAIFVAECQMRLILLAIREVVEGEHRTIAVTQAAHDAHVAEVDALHEKMVWKSPNVTNWYRNPAGRVFAVLPYRLVDFWEMTRSLRADDFALE
jgi:4-hydroxyacetophenone monooxygenase